ncbi:MAG: DJ-1/PfpI family protein [Myxococcales bacterium]|nr:DJ-1/PfpI family protein [Myxococcales bacterium]
MTRCVDVVLFDGFADWEPALALAELRSSAGVQVRTHSFDGEAVTSMGGLRVAVDGALAAVDVAGSSLLMLVGGEAWEQEAYPRNVVEDVVARCLDAEVSVAAICGATVALARGGFLAGRDHTSNDPGWLGAMAPDYAGSERYVSGQLAVRSGGVITASGTGSVAFAAEILAQLEVFDDTKRSVWRALYQTGSFPADADVQAFFAGS